jgi:hypothetical protein
MVDSAYLRKPQLLVFHSLVFFFNFLESTSWVWSGFIILSAEAAAILFPASNHKGLRRNKTDRYEIESLTQTQRKKLRQIS